uniref:Putative group i salivary lipocalin n=1 Tax=Rhipicephalus pulchellus TaxID=72859 RepID=L7LSX8_RHIPC
MKFITFIIFTLFMNVKQSLLISFSFQEFEDYDIKKFLNTTEPIWTYNTTAYKRRMCKVDVMRNITQELIIFNRSYFRRRLNTTTTTAVTGKFSDEFEDELTTGPKGAVVVAQEQLFYVNEAYTCGIFMVIPERYGFYPHYDLRVKNSSIINGREGIDPNCTIEFDGIGPQGQLAYQPECQRIMFPSFHFS